MILVWTHCPRENDNFKEIDFLRCQINIFNALEKMEVRPKKEKKKLILGHYAWSFFSASGYFNKKNNYTLVHQIFKSGTKTDSYYIQGSELLSSYIYIFLSS